MRRSAKARRIGPKAWLLGLVVVAAGLVALFSLLPMDRLAKALPLAIRSTEVRAYAALLDRRPAEVGHTKADLFRFGGSKGLDACIEDQTGAGWRTRWFEAEGYGDSVEVRHLRDRPGFLVKFRKDAPLGGQRRMMLVPTTVEGIRAKYLEVLAGELGLLTPSVSFVRLIACGRDLGLYRKEEWLDNDFLERRGLSNATLVEQGLDPTRPDRQFAVIHGDSAERSLLRGTIEQALAGVARGSTDAIARLVDEKAAIAWLLMAWIDGRDLRREPLVLAHQWSTGRMIPIYRTPQDGHPSDTTASLAYNLMTPLLRSGRFREQFERAQAELMTRLPELQDRFEALDKAWLPVLAEPAVLPFARTAVEQVRITLLVDRPGSKAAAPHLDRPLFFGPGHATFLHGMPLPQEKGPAISDSTLLAAIAGRYKLILQGDSILFPRGKYRIDEDLLFPAGCRVIMLQGARLFMGAGRSLLCKGDLYIRGTLRNPVFIRPQDDSAPFGTIAVLGGGSQQCEIGGLYVSGGVGAVIDGVRHTGMVSVQGMARTTVHASVLEDHGATDALLINGGEVDLDHVRSTGDGHGHLRLEHVRGMLRDVVVRDAATSSKAAGLHLRACQLVIDKAEISLPDGVGIAVDAASRLLVRNSTIRQCATAVEASDLSIVHLEGNTVSDNGVALVGKGSGPNNGGRFVIYTNTFVGNAKDRVLDAHSAVELKGAMEPGTLEAFGPGAEEILPDATMRRRTP